MGMNDKLGGDPAEPSAETILTHFGRDPDAQFGFVNTPVFRGSTVLFKTLADHDAPTQPYTYGRAGNPTTSAVESLVSELEGAAGTTLVPSGLAAITVAMLSTLKAGDEVLVTDSAYEPTRTFCNKLLKRHGRWRRAIMTQGSASVFRHSSASAPRRSGSKVPAL